MTTNLSNTSENNSPAISIICPVYNVAKFLPECLDSILRQTFTDWELILVDDGATDDCGKICDEYAAKDSRIKVFHKSNSGLADTRNYALERSSGRYIGFVDSDDWIEDDMFSVLYQTITSSDADIAVCNYYDSFVQKEKLGRALPQDKILTREEGIDLLIRDKEFRSFVWNKLYKREVLVVPMPVSMLFEDYSTMVKWFSAADKIAYTTRPLYHYRQRGGSIDKGSDPKKSYHFFLAAKDRCNFLKDSNIFPDRQREFELRVVKAGVGQIKEIMRKCSGSPQKYNYICLIRSEIQEYLPVTIGEVGLKCYLRLNLLNLSKKTLNYILRFTGNFVLKNQVGSRLKKMY